MAVGGSFWEGGLAEIHRGPLVMLTHDSPRARAADASALALVTAVLLGLALIAWSYLGGLGSRQLAASEAAREHTLPIRLRGSATVWYWSVAISFGILAWLSADPLQHPLSGTRPPDLGSFAILLASIVVVLNGVSHLSDIAIDASGISHRGFLLRMKRIEFSD